MKRFVSLVLFFIFVLSCLCGVMIQNVIAEGTASAITYKLDYYDGALPTSYRNTDVCKIDNQGSHGDCWAFATLSTLQTNMKKMGFVNSNSADGFYDFSESALTYFCYGYTCTECYGKNIDVDSDGQGHCKDCGGIAVCVQIYGLYNSYDNSGGNFVGAISSMVSAPVLIYEDDWGFNTNYPAVDIPDNCDELVSDFKINSVKVGHTLDDMKRMIYSYGAVTFDLHISNVFIGSFYNADDGETYYTMWSNLLSRGGHALSAVGYDDNFSKDNFKVNRSELVSYIEDAGQYGASIEFNEVLSSLDIPTYSDEYEDMADPNYVQNAIDYINGLTDDELNAKYAPQSDGAVLLKNSWGLFSESTTGYVWVPYEYFDDWKASNYSLFSFDSVTYGDTFDCEYEHDEFGAISFIAGIPATASTQYIQYANIYDFETVSELKQISFFTYAHEDCDCSVYYAPAVNGVIIDSQKVLLAKKHITTSDYYITVELENKITIPAETGAIILEFPADKKVYIGIDMCYDKDSNTVCSYTEKDESRINSGLGYEYCTIINDRYYSWIIKLGTDNSQETPMIFPADYSVYYSFIGQLNAMSNTLIPKYFTQASYEYYLIARNYFLNIDKNLEVWDQAEINNANSIIAKAVNSLEVLPADYTEYNALKEKLEVMNLKSRDYTDESWADYVIAKQAFDSLSQKYSIFYQDAVDNAVANMLAAFKALKPYVNVDYEKLKTDYDELIKDYISSNNEYVELGKKYVDLALELADTEKALDSALNTLDATEKTADEYSKQIESLEKQLNELTEEYNKLSEELTKTKKELTDTQNELEQVKQQLKDSTENEKKISDDLNALTNDFNELNDKLTESENSLTATVSELEKAKQDLATAAENYNKLTEENNSVKLELEECESSLADTLEKYEKSQKDLAASVENETKLSDELKAKSEEYDALKAKYDESDTALSEAIAKLEQANKDLETADSKDEVAKLEQTVAQLQAEIASLIEEISKMEAETNAPETSYSGCNGTVGLILPICILGSALFIQKKRKK